jgi:GT2 family glycosyltransferase
MSYCILIPTVNRKDLLMEALDWYIPNLKGTEIIVLDNGKQCIASGAPNLKVFESEENKGVAGSWNWLINKAIERGHTNFLILNDDIILKRNHSEIIDIIYRWGDNTFHRPRPFYNWSAFILNKSIYEKVGEFDEAFEKCFFEDNDYEYRMRLAGITIRYEDALNAEVYRNSQTIEKDPLLGGYIQNRDYYIYKWGGIPESETYKTPFNL